MLCNMDYLGHLVAFRDLDLRSNFEVDLLWLTYRYMIRFVSTRQTRWLLYDYFAVLVPWRLQFWPERRNGWSTFLLFFNDLSNAAFCLSPTLRSRVRRGRIPPPPPQAGCVTIGAPALRGLTSIFCSPSSSSPKRRKFWFWTDPWRHQWPQSQILTLFGEFTSAGLSNSVWNLEIGPVVWKISGGGGPFASPIRTCCHPAPIVARVKSSGFLSPFCKKSHWFQQSWNLLPMPTNQPFTSTETVSVR